MAEVYNLLLSNGSQYSYHIVYSKRAKYICIKLSQQGSLSVTLPVFTDVRFAHEFIASKISWIEKNLANIKPQVNKIIPEILDLKLLQELWTISYVETEESSQKDLLKFVEKKNYELEIKGTHNQLNNGTDIARILNQWCKNKADTVFNNLLQKLAELHGFHYQRLTIRAQKTRWGSCTHQKNINLNCKLLFMPEEIVSYVMIHELCHTIEMNHSSRFWRLVEDCDPQYRENRHRLKHLGRDIVI